MSKLNTLLAALARNPAVVTELRAELAQTRAHATSLQQQLAQVANIIDQIESAAASATQNREERIEAAIERDGVWSSSRDPGIARASMAIDIQTDIAKRLRRVLAGGEAPC